VNAAVRFRFEQANQELIVTHEGMSVDPSQIIPGHIRAMTTKLHTRPMTPTAMDTREYAIGNAFGA
jgi:hypothetical protein